MKKKDINKKQSLEKEVSKYNLLITLGTFLILIVCNVVLYKNDLYVVFHRIDAIGLLWAIIGFAFTIYCFIIPKLSKSSNLLDRFETCIGVENYVEILGKKAYFKIKRIALILNMLKLFLFSTLSFMIILTFDTLRYETVPDNMKILINILSNIIETFVAFIYLIIIYLAQNQFDAANGLDDETLEELRSSIKTMETWGNEDKALNKKKEYKNGKDENAK